MASITASSILILFFFLSLSMPSSVTASNKVSAIFAFGDSTLDSGNNNHLDTLFRCNHIPYGRDFPTHIPTGRFSNGKIATDYLSQFLGIKELLPAFLDPQVTDRDLLTGVSFGSGGSGLDIRTVGLTRVLDLGTQFELFEEALMRIINIVGDEKANDIVRNALFVISIGTNDMLYNAYMSSMRLSTSHASVSAYQDFLLQTLQNFIQRLYGAGARRIMVAGLPPIGCLPIQVTMSSVLPSRHWLQRVCINQLNMDSQNYNTKLQSHIHSLQTTLHDAKVAYFDIYSPILDMVINPNKYGFEHSLQGCCGTGLVELGPLCNAVDIVCPDPSKYLFWDAVHPTQAGYLVLANSGRQILPYLTS